MAQHLVAADDWPMFKTGVTRAAVASADALAAPFVLKWSSSTSAGPVNYVAYSSPVELNNRVFIGGMDGTLFAFNGTVGSQTNSPLWSYKTTGSIYGSPAVATIGGQDYVFVGTTQGNLYCFNAVTGGSPIWTETLGGAIFTSPVVVFEASTNTTLVLCASHSGSLFAFNTTTPTSPSLSWSKVISNNFLFASPAYDSDNDLVLEPSYDGNLYALHVSGSQAGQAAWTRPVSPTRSSPAITLAIPSVTSGYIYNLSNNGMLTCLVKSTGAIKASVSISSTASSSCAAFRRANSNFDNIIVCGQNGTVQEWSLSDSGAEFARNWQTQLSDSIYSSPAVTSANLNGTPLAGTVLVGCNDGKLYALNLLNGLVVKTVTMNNTVQVSPAVAQGNLLVSSSFGNLQAWAVPTPTPTYTPTGTSTPTPSSTVTRTYTPTLTPTNTFTFTPYPKAPCQGVALTNSIGGMNSPNGMAINYSTDNIYVTDTNNKLVKIFNGSTGAQVGVFGSPKLTSPNDIGFDASGNIYVSDYNNGEVDEFDGTSFGFKAAIGTGGVGNPRGVCVDSEGNTTSVYITSQNNNVYRYDNTGNGFNTNPVVFGGGSVLNVPNEIVKAGNVIYVGDDGGRIISFTGPNYTSAIINNPGEGSLKSLRVDLAGVFYTGEFNGVDRYLQGPSSPPMHCALPNNPWGVVVDASGKIFAGQQATGAVTVLQGCVTEPTLTPTPTPCCQGVALTNSISGLNFPNGMAINYSTDNIYVTDANNKLVKIFNGSTGAMVGVFGSPKLTSPNDIGFDASGNIYVSDYNNGEVDEFDGTSFGFKAAIGTGGVGNPRGVCVDSEGNTTSVYITSQNNNVYRYDNTGSGFNTNPVVFGGSSVLNVPNEIVKVGNAIYVGDDGGRIISFTGSNYAPATVNNPGVGSLKSLRVDLAGVFYTGEFGGVDKYLRGPSSPPSHCALPNNPWGVVVDASGKIFAGQQTTGAVTVLQGCVTEPTLTPTPTPCCQGVAFWNPIRGLNSPNGMAINYATGNIYVTDTNNKLVKIFNGSSAQVGVFGSPKLTLPNDIGFDASGNIYVSDYNNGEVDEFDGNSFGFKAAIGTGGVGNPRGVCVDSEGNTTSVYITSQNNNVYRYDNTGSGFNTNPVVFGGSSVLNVPNEIVKVGTALYVGDDGGRIISFTGSNYVPATINNPGEGSLKSLRVDLAGIFYTGEFNGVDRYLQGPSSPPSHCALPNNPWGMVVDASGRIFAGEQSSGTVTLLQGCVTEPTLTPVNSYTATFTPTATPTITPTSTVTPLPTLSYCPLVKVLTGFGDPSPVALDTNSSCNGVAGPCLYIADGGNNSIGKYSSNGSLVAAWGSGGKISFNGPGGLAVDGSGLLYVTDTVNNQVAVYDANGNLLHQWGQTGSGPLQFQYPSGIAVAAGSVPASIYVADSGNSRIEVLGPTGNLIGQWGTPGWEGNGTFESPWGVALDANGKVFVCDNETDLTQVFDYAGNFLWQWDVTQAGSLLGAESVGVDANGVVYVSDGFDAVALFDSFGQYLAPVPGGILPFDDPEGLAVSKAGVWLAADSGNEVVDEFDTYSIPATPVGTAVNTRTWTFTPTPTGTPTFTFTATPTYTTNYANCCVIGWSQSNNTYSFVAGIAVDPVRNIGYVSSVNSIGKFDLSNGNLMGLVGAEFEFGGESIINGYAPMAIGPDGFIYIASGGPIYKVDPGSGAIVATFPQPSLNTVTYAINVDSNDNIYVAAGNNIYRYDGSYHTLQFGTSSLNLPSGVAKTGNLLFVGDTGNSRLLICQSTANNDNWDQVNVVTSAGGWSLNNLQQFTRDAAGNVYLTQANGSGYLVYNSTGSLIYSCKGSQFGGTEAIAVSPNGNIYIGDRGKNRVYEVNGGCVVSVPYTPTPTNSFTFTITPTFTPSLTPTPAPISTAWVQATGAASFSPRTGQASAFYNGQLWVVGGRDSQGSKNDVWSSWDGVNWKLKAGHAAFGPRAGHNLLVYNNQMWLMGGYDGTVYMKDVWNSSDGVTWNLVTNDAGFGPRAYAGGLVFNNQMWVMGGATSYQIVNDAWYSTDGNGWTRASIDQFPARSNFGSVAFNNQMWLIGGMGPAGPLGDVWNSPDGIHWNYSTLNAGFGPLSAFTSLVYDSQIFVVGGQTASGSSNAVYSSADGTHWNPFNPTASFGPRSGHSSVVASLAANSNQCQMWVVGGQTGPGNYLDDVWYAPPPQGATPTATFTTSPTPSIASCSLVNTLTVPNPFGAAMDGQGNIYVIDDVNNEVSVFNSQGSLLRQWGAGGTGPGQFNSPEAIALDGNGKVYVADSANDRVEVFDNQGNFISQWGRPGNGPTQFEFPSGIAVSPATGWVYVVDSDNSRVEVFDTLGDYGFQWGGTGNGNGTFNTPWSVALDPNGQVYVTDNTNSLVQVFSPTGGFLHQWNVQQAGLATAESVAVDSNGVVYVTDGDGVLGFFDTLGDYLGSSTGGSVTFGGPEGVAASNGTWVVADADNGGVYHYNSCGLTPVVGLTPVITISGTLTPIIFTSTATPTGTNSFTSTPTATPTATATATSTSTATSTPTSTYTPTITPLYSYTPTPTPCCQGVALSNAINGFNGPQGIAANYANGNIYVADTNNKEVKIFNGSTGASVGVFGSSKLNGPNDIGFDANGNVYVSDGSNGEVDEFDGNSFAFKTAIGTGAVGDPRGVFVDNEGNTTSVYITSGNDNVYRYDNTGSGFNSNPVIFGGSLVLATPNGIVKVGNVVYVVDDAGRIISFTGSNYAPATINSPGGSLKSIRVDLAGIFYTGDFVASGGVDKYIAGVTNPPSRCHLPFNPWGVAVDATGKIFVTENGAGSVTVLQGCVVEPTLTSTSTITNTPVVPYTPTSTFTTTSTSTPTSTPTVTPTYTPTFTPCCQGVALATPITGLNGPIGMAVNYATGNIYVTDSNNHQVKIFNSSTGALVGVFGLTKLTFPNDIGFDSNWNVYVSDGNNGEVDEFDGNSFAFEAAIGTGVVWSPRGVCVDSEGNTTSVYITSGNDNVYRYDNTGSGFNTNPVVFGGNTVLNVPNEIVKVGNVVYVVDDGGRIISFTGSNYSPTIINNPGLGSLKSIRVDLAGIFYTGEFGGVDKYVGGPSSQPCHNALPNNPWGVVVDSTGKIFAGQQTTGAVTVLQSLVTEPTLTPTLTFTPTITFTNTWTFPYTYTPIFTATPTLPTGVNLVSCPTGNPASGYAQTQKLLAEGVGLEETVVGGASGQPLSLTLPPGAVPVTALLYVEYNSGSYTAGNTTAVTFNGNTTPLGILAGAPVSYIGWVQTFYNVRYGLNPAWITDGGTNGSLSTYTVNTPSSGDSGQGLALAVLYVNPSETSLNAVAIADGNNAWHIEGNGLVAYGGAPPDADLNWSCAGLSNSTSRTKLSVIGGAAQCWSGTNGDQDQLEPYGSGPVTNPGAADNGGPPVWTGPAGVLNCVGGASGASDRVRNYDLGFNFQSAAQSLEWGLPFGTQLAKSSFWQQAVVAQYQSNPVQQCSVTTSFNQTFVPYGWVAGTIPPSEGSWGEGAGSVSMTSSGFNGLNNFLVNNQVYSAPGTLQVSMCENLYPSNLGGLVFGYNPINGNGYGLQFLNNGASSPASLIWVTYTGGVSTAGTSAALGNGALNSCPYWVEVDVNSSCQYAVKLGGTQTGLVSAPVTATFSVHGCASGGFNGLSANSSENSTFQYFQWTAASCPALPPVNSPTATNTFTNTITYTPSITPSFTPNPPPNYAGCGGTGWLEANNTFSNLPNGGGGVAIDYFNAIGYLAANNSVYKFNLSDGSLPGSNATVGTVGQFSGASMIAMGSNGLLYVAGSQNGSGVIWIVNTGTGAILTTLNPNNLGTPWGIDVDTNGDIYFTTATSTVYRYKLIPPANCGQPYGYNLASLQMAGSSLGEAMGVAKVGASLFVADLKNNRIMMYQQSVVGSNNFDQAFVVNNAGSFQMTSPKELSKDLAGNVYLADWGASFYGVYGPDGSFKYSAQVPAAPFGIGVDAGGKIYYSDIVNNRMIQMTGGCMTEPTFYTPTSTSTCNPNAPTGTQTNTFTISPTFTPTPTSTFTFIVTPVPVSTNTYPAVPFVAYTDGANSNKCTVMEYTGSTWAPVGSPGFTSGVVGYPSLAMLNGIPYVAFEDGANSNKCSVMTYNGNSWVPVGTPGFSAGAAYNPSLVISNGTLYVAYEDAGNSNKCTVMQYDGITWLPVGGSGFSSGGISNPSLAATSNGTLYVAYMDGANSNKCTVMTLNGSAWGLVGNPGFSAGTAYNPSMGVSNSTPFVAYADSAHSNGIMVMEYTNSAWGTFQSFNSGWWTSSSQSMAMWNGWPYVAYQDGSGYVMSYNPGNQYLVGGKAFSSGSISNPSLAISNGTIYVAYADGANSNKCTVVTNGSPWGPVGNAGFSNGSVANVSLALSNSLIVPLTLTPTNTPIPSTPTTTPIPLSWSPADSSAPFSAREGHASVYFNSQYWVIGGLDSNGPKNDVWYSSDGVNWRTAPTTAAFSPRYGHQALVYNNQIWVLGGYNGNSYLSDVWSSPDGLKWSPASGGLPNNVGRAFGGAVTYSGSMWLIGGAESTGVTNDVWSSTTGNSWTPATNQANFSARMNFGCVDYGNQMWVMGGTTSSGAANDVWSSSNGSSWNPQTSLPISAGLSWVSGLTYNNQIYALGSNGSIYGDWTYPNNQNWTSVMPPPSPRFEASSFSTNNSMWVIGGQVPGSSPAAFYNDVWVSPPYPTNTPGGSSEKPLLNSSGESAASLTPTPTSTFTATPSPTFEPRAFQVVVAPNVSKGGQPIQFQVGLGQPTQIQLTLYSLAGEQVYQASMEGNSGVNSLVWNISNSSNAPVANGLYIYAIEVNGSAGSWTKTGKVAVLR